ncbi:MAG: hypothetical protein LBH60_08805 [Prevotellaceae bacterium]|jgi:hypothetical protein|nr:hypothetical protein [Prevotellaceae bacterium]
METEQKDKLYAYAVKMIERGDRFSDILMFLERKGADSRLIKEITAKFETHRKMLANMEEKKKPYPVSVAKIVIGIAFCGLTLYLQHYGIISFPLTIPGYIVAIGVLIEMAKIIVNIFKNRKSQT